MPTLPTYQSREQLQQVQRPNIGKQYGVGDVLGSIGQTMNKVEIADRKNKIDDATIQTKKGLALRQASFLEDPLADKEEYVEDMSRIVETGSGSLGHAEDRRVFSRDMSLTTTLLGIEATGARATAIDVRGQENSYTKLKEQQSQPPALRTQLIQENLDEAVALGHFKQKDADILNSGANVNNAIYDAKDAKSAKQVMAIVSDEKFDNSIYKLTNDERKSVYAEVKNLHDMYVVGDEFESLSNDDLYAQQTAVVIGSSASQAMKSRKIFDLGVELGISGPKRGMAQARLASKVGVQPSGTKDNKNKLFLKITRMALNPPENAEQAMSFLKRQRETLDEIDYSYDNGLIGHPEYLELTQKLGKDLTKAKSLAMGQIQELDDDPQWDFLPQNDRRDSYENAYEDFSAKMTNTSLRADYFDEYTKVVERMEDGGAVPPYVDKSKDKWGRRADVKSQMFGQYEAGKTPRAQETLTGATRSIRLPSEQSQNIVNSARKAGLGNQELAIFMGQIAHESGGFKNLEEIGDDAYFKKYDNKMGNTEAGDGTKYKGRGYIQLTGKANYAEYGNELGIDLVNEPELAADPQVAEKVALLYWQKRVQPKLKGNSLEEDIRIATKAIQGGDKHYEERLKQTMKYIKS